MPLKFWLNLHFLLLQLQAVLFKGKKLKKSKATNPNHSLSNQLFQAYLDTEDILTRAAISYLLKNGCKVDDRQEDPEKFAKRRRKVEIRIQRLTEQLALRQPKGRDLNNCMFLETLATATTTVPQNETQARSWQDNLLKRPSSIPFPVIFETNEDMVWSQNQTGRICVCFTQRRRTYL